MFVVHTAPQVSFQPLSSSLTYPWVQQTMHTVRYSKTIGIMNRISRTAMFKRGNKSVWTKARISHEATLGDASREEN